MKRCVAIAGLACLFGIPSIIHAQNQPTAKAGDCSSLTRLQPFGAKITEATMVAPGAFVAPGKSDPKREALYKGLPGFCRATIHAKPSTDSDVAIEVWMPATGWNGKFRGIGNGGFAGYIDYAALATAVQQGYATASTDTGHKGSEDDPALDSAWALGHPEKIADFGYRAIHLMTVDAKAVIGAYYGKGAERAYFASCSNGGRQGLMEAQRFPGDYDGILAGAPAYDWTSLTSSGITVLQKFDGPGYISAAKVPAIGAAVVAQCDAMDGVKDGLVSDPPQCHLDTSGLRCKGGTESDACLTNPQIASLKTLYGGKRDSAGKMNLPGFSPGGEDGPGGWQDWITGKEAGKSVGAGFTNGFFRNMVYDDPQWTYRTASMDAAFAEANRKLGNVLNATDPNLRAFQLRGGKLILYHGWSDPAIPAEDTVRYYDRAEEILGQEKIDGFVRLYMAPGMQHCGGGPGPNVFAQSGDSSRTDPSHDIYAALERWVESDVAPTAIIATKYVENDSTKPVQMTRPLCPYPQIAKYKGNGDTNEAGSFSCVQP
jgi:hypothetical protein